MEQAEKSISKFPKIYLTQSEIEDPKNSVRSGSVQEEKNESSQDWERVIVHVVTNTIVTSYRKKPYFSHNCEKLEDKICAASCIFK